MAIATSPIQLALRATSRSPVRLRNVPPWLHPRQIERGLAAFFQRLMAEFSRNVTATVIPALPQIEEEAKLEQGRIDGQRADAWPDRVGELMAILQIGATKRVGTARAEAVDIGQRSSVWNDKEWQKILRRTVGVSLLTEDPGLRTQLRLFADTNANLITKLQDEKIANIRGIIERGFSAGTRHTELAKEIRGEVGKAKNRARLIARDQVSKLNGNLTHSRQVQAGIPHYIWQTAADERVRPSHRKMQGKLARWDDASLYADVSDPTNWKNRSGIDAVELHPGQDIICRCFAEPFIQELAPEQEAA